MSVVSAKSPITEPSDPDVTNHDLLDTLPRLTLFAEGIIGRTFHVLPIDTNTEDALHPQNNGPFATQRTIHLPANPLPGLRSSKERKAAAWLVMVLQQLAPLLFGTHLFRLEPSSAIEPDSKVSSGSEMLGDLQKFFNQSHYPALTRHLFYACEAIRHDSCIRREYPGIKAHLETLNQHRIDRAAENTTEQAISRLPPLVALICEALLVMECVVDTQPKSFVAPDPITRLLHEAKALRNEDQSVYDSRRITMALLDQLNLTADQADPTLLEELEAADSADNHVAEMAQQEEAIDALEFDLFMLDEELELIPGEEPGSISMMRDLENERDALKRRIDMQKAKMSRIQPKTDQSASRSFLYDEWDYLQGTYLRGWCRLFERELEPGDPQELRELERRVGEHARRVRRQFEQIRPIALERIKPLEEGDEIYLDALIDHEIDRRTGRQQEARVYSTNTRKKRWVATAFLVDLSASTDDAIPDPDAPEKPQYEFDDDDPYAFDNEPLEPEKPKRRIIDVQREALWLMSQALQNLGDDFGIYGFSGYGRDEVEVFLVKELGEALSSRVLQSVMNMQPRRSTRMGPAIRHAVKKLRGREAGRRILILVSDGFPQDSDYGPNRGDHEYGVQDTAKALLEAQAAGVETFCITVDTSGHDYLNRMCPEQRYMVIEEIEELPNALTKVYRRLAF